MKVITKSRPFPRRPGNHTLLWVGYSVDNPTLNRFFSLHYLLPFVLLVSLYLGLAPSRQQQHPPAYAAKSSQDTLPLTSYYTMKDAFAIVVFLMVMRAGCSSARTISLTRLNYEVANPLVMLAHIVPEWYYLPFYAIRRPWPRALPRRLDHPLLARYVAVGRAHNGHVPGISSGVRDRVRGAGLSRLEAGRRRLCDLVAQSLTSTIRALHHHPAPARPARKPEPHRRSRTMSLPRSGRRPPAWWPSDPGSRTWKCSRHSVLPRRA